MKLSTLKNSGELIYITEKKGQSIVKSALTAVPNLISIETFFIVLAT